MNYQELKPLVTQLLQKTHKNSLSRSELEESLRLRIGTQESTQHFKNKLGWALRELCSEHQILKGTRNEIALVPRSRGHAKAPAASMPTGRRFEEQCKELLKNSGFEKIRILGKTGDKGIDGQAIYKIANGIVLRFCFQCKGGGKRVSSPKVREFIGSLPRSLSGGLIFSTSGFTAEAHKIASNSPSPPVFLLGPKTLNSRNKPQ